MSRDCRVFLQFNNRKNFSEKPIASSSHYFIIVSYNKNTKCTSSFDFDGLDNLCSLKLTTTYRYSINVIAFYELGVFCGTLCCQYFCWFVVINIVHDFVFILWFCCASVVVLVEEGELLDNKKPYRPLYIFRHVLKIISFCSFESV
jgi:hypothetical protein